MSAEVIMGQIPTIVGMGVISTTTTTMFGKGKRKSKTTKSKFKVYQGKRGGKYIKKNGRKIYI